MEEPRIHILCGQKEKGNEEEAKVIIALEPAEEVALTPSLEESDNEDDDAEDDLPAVERGLTLEESNEKACKLDKLYKKFYKLIGEDILTWWF